MPRKHSKRSYLFVARLTAVASVVLQRYGMTQADSERLGEEIAMQMCSQYARTLLYIPATLEQSLKIDSRNRQILDAYSVASPTARPFTVARMDELSREYGLARTQLYQLLHDTLDTVRAEQGLPKMGDRQGSLNL